MLQRYKKLIPILFLAVCSLITVIAAIQGNVILAGESYDFVPALGHYSGIVAISLAVMGFYRFPRLYKYILAVTFLLGLFKITKFTPMDYLFGLGYEGSRLQLDSVSLAFGLLVYWTNSSTINRAVFGAMKPSATRAHQTELVEIENFKDRFSRKTTEEITQIVAAKALVPAALVAAQQLLTERQ